ncbi:Spermatogenesis-associated protein 7, partial [Anas platyrhynchos]
AFCIDSTRSLTNQYLIRDHMMFHYNRILSAKAAVDCSAPRSRLTSIKLADQQRRERLRKKIARCEKEMSVGKNASRSSSRESGRLLSTSFGQVDIFILLKDKDSLFPSVQHARYLSRALLPYGEHGLVHSSPVKHTRKHSRNTSNMSNSNSSVSMSSTPRKHSGVSSSCSSDSSVSIGRSQRHQDRNPKVYSGDLLDRHSELFTGSRKPFTPRTLISDAKSVLSGYRYYTPARRKRKNRCKRHVEAETQTDAIRMAPEESQMQSTTKGLHNVAFCYFLSFVFLIRETLLYSEQSSARTNIEAEEDDLLYLTFIEDVTNEILNLGLFSNRVLEQLFECYIEENKSRLDENKMRHLLDVLKADLSCSTEESHTDWEAVDSLDLEEFNMAEEPELTRKSQRQKKATKSEEFLTTMDLLLKEP